MLKDREIRKRALGIAESFGLRLELDSCRGKHLKYRITNPHTDQSALVVCPKTFGGGRGGGRGDQNFYATVKRTCRSLIDERQKPNEG